MEDEAVVPGHGTIIWLRRHLSEAEWALLLCVLSEAGPDAKALRTALMRPEAHKRILRDMVYTTPHRDPDEVWGKEDGPETDTGTVLGEGQ